MINYLPIFYKSSAYLLGILNQNGFEQILVKKKIVSQMKIEKGLKQFIIGL